MKFILWLECATWNPNLKNCIPAHSDKNLNLFTGVTYPSIPPLITLWVPEMERARFVSFTYLGGALGSAVCFPIAGLILEWGGWETVFYLFGRYQDISTSEFSATLFQPWIFQSWIFHQWTFHQWTFQPRTYELFNMNFLTMNFSTWTFQPWTYQPGKVRFWNVLQPFDSLTIVWSIVWFFYVTDDPVNHGSITSEEKTYILENRGPTSVSGQASDGEIRQKMMKKTPFKKMILTPMVWVIMICEFANIWGILVMINEGPNFIDKILKRSISGVSKIM